MTTVGGESVLVVEDDEGSAILVRRTLERQGLQVFTAAGLEEAVVAVKTRPFHLIVTDYRLGDGTGLELHDRLKSLDADIPIILVTGYSDEATVIEAIRRGIRDFVPKTEKYLEYLPNAVERVMKTVRTERELAVSEARFHLFMDNSPVSAIIKDESGRLVYANRTAQQILGRSDWQNKSDYELWPPETAERLRSHDAAVMDGGVPVELEQTVTLATGEARHIHSYKFPIEDAGGQRLLGSVSIDVTQQRAAEEELRARDEQLRHSQKMEAIGTLAGGIAHEFNNLLQAVLGYTRFASSLLEDDHPAQADLNIVVAAAERAALLTRQLLTFSRREESELTPMDVNLAIHELADMIRPLLGEHVALKLDLADELSLIEADPAQIQQMLMNLCVNARDAMPSGGTITISTRAGRSAAVASSNSCAAERQFITVAVSDTGCGMAETVKRKIFEPFFTTKEAGKGTGLGLAMVYGAVQRHGGGIEVDSEPGRGSRFTVRLPAVSATCASAAADPVSELPAGQETILVAEDEPLVLNLTKRILEDAGYKVVTACDGCEAVDVFRERRAEIDLLIVDAVMPKKSGWEAIRDIREICPEAPAIVLSGYGPQHSLEAENEVSPRLLQKPVSAGQLLGAVRTTLNEARVCPTIAAH